MEDVKDAHRYVSREIMAAPPNSIRVFCWTRSQWWDADHIVSVVEGGGECGLDNYRTLCLPCHRKVTRELHARLADARKKQKATVKDQERGLLNMGIADRQFRKRKERMKRRRTHLCGAMFRVLELSGIQTDKPKPEDWKPPTGADQEEK